jgi:hypothetical protein
MPSQSVIVRTAIECANERRAETGWTFTCNMTMVAEIWDGPADELRTVDQLVLPDVRIRNLCVREGAVIRALTQDDRHESISSFSLAASVPQDIRVHFDTARNIYLYAWFVYRMHVVAEQHALSTLELALRTALVSRGFVVVENSKLYVYAGSKKRVVSGLRQLLDLAVKHDLISNERLPLREKWAISVAEYRMSREQIAHMQERGLDQMVFPLAEPVPTDEELGIDWIGRFCEALPEIRNDYAHGSSTLHATVLRTFEVVWSLVNQMFTHEHGDCVQSAA